ncbi:MULTISPECIES: hypothetical protein [unclassified Nocardiopsis]|uniref:hypothetical protein n=1 Tax=unclassified Nocardiopsis TaxID=2649073 RepID=UPI00135CF531|nr:MULTISPECIES: hypothetical protein [unclassified Nocardiopsis]
MRSFTRATTTALAAALALSGAGAALADVPEAAGGQQRPLQGVLGMVLQDLLGQGGSGGGTTVPTSDPEDDADPVPADVPNTQGDTTAPEEGAPEDATAPEETPGQFPGGQVPGQQGTGSQGPAQGTPDFGGMTP